MPRGSTVIVPFRYSMYRYLIRKQVITKKELHLSLWAMTLLMVRKDDGGFVFSRTGRVGGLHIHNVLFPYTYTYVPACITHLYVYVYTYM